MANKHWESLPDKGPQPNDDVPPHRRKRGKRTFTIDCRYVGPAVEPQLKFMLRRDWHVFRRYETEKAMQEAFASLIRKNELNLKYYPHEYRMNRGGAEKPA